MATLRLWPDHPSTRGVSTSNTKGSLRFNADHDRNGRIQRIAQYFHHRGHLYDLGRHQDDNICAKG